MTRQRSKREIETPQALFHDRNLNAQYEEGDWRGYMASPEETELRLQESPKEQSSHDEVPLPINGALYPVDFEDPRVVNAFMEVVKKVIRDLGGVPVELKVAFAQNPFTGSLYPRMVARFETEQLSTEQLSQLEEVTRRAYGKDIRGTKTKQGKTAGMHSYPIINARGKEKSIIDTTIGWYFGTEDGNPNRLTKGIFAYRKISRQDIASGVRARKNGDWFTQEKLYDNTGEEFNGGPYIIEVREGGMYNANGGKVIEAPFQYQTDLAQTIVYISLLLAGKELPPEKPGLIYEIYHEMNQIGLGAATQLPGLDDHIREVEKTLIVPLASPKLTRGLKGNPKSTGLIGQVGTGKTQVIKHFLNQKQGIMMIPIGAAEFEVELHQSPNNRRILPRIRDIAEKTGKSVVIVIEDLENLAHESNPTSKLLLNELAGLYNSGYRILWTTNHPEVFNHQLLEPERLGGKIIFCGLPILEARKNILEQHLVHASREMKIPVFDPAKISPETEGMTSEGTRDLMLRAIAVATEGFTPRFLKDIVLEAIDNFMYRIAQREERVYGLDENHLEGDSFTLEDWGKALKDVSARYDVKARQAEDERLRKIVDMKSSGSIGFGNENEKPEINLRTIIKQQLR